MSLEPDNFLIDVAFEQRVGHVDYFSIRTQAVLPFRHRSLLKPHSDLKRSFFQSASNPLQVPDLSFHVGFEMTTFPFPGSLQVLERAADRL